MIIACSMEREQSLLKSIVVEALIPEDGGANLSDLFEQASSTEDLPDAGIANVKRRDLLFIGMTNVHLSSKLLM